MSTTVPFSFARSDNGTETVVVLGTQGVRVVSSSHPNFERVRDLLLAGETDEALVYRYADSTTRVLDALRRLSDRVTIRRDTLYVDGDEVENRLTRHIADMIRNDDDNYVGYVAFLENLQANPSKNSRKALFKFLDKHDLLITEDGCFIGYKGISNDGLSCTAGSEPVTVTLEDGTVEEHTGRIPNPVGAVVEMPRSLVDPERNRACSVGLHVGNHRYATGFGVVLLTVKVNPRDVVSVPNDSNDEKIRTCRYEVVEQNDSRTRYQGTSWFGGDVPVDESEDDETDECSCCGRTVSTPDSLDENDHCENCQDCF
jgi:hypothetical protein